MLKTIMIGRHIAVQGDFVKLLENGLMMVRVGKQTFTGKPVQDGITPNLTSHAPRVPSSYGYGSPDH